MADIPGTPESWHRQWQMMKDDRDRLQDELDHYQKEYGDARDEIDRYREALERASVVQQNTLGWLRHNGIVFDGPLGTDPGNWQHVAFSIYTDLCEVDTIARAALTTPDTPPTVPDEPCHECTHDYCRCAYLAATPDTPPTTGWTCDREDCQGRPATPDTPPDA